MVTMNVLDGEPPSADAPAEDVRFERTRARLAAAVIALASERDITTASVAELTRRAGINRATFYNHANSPIELLTRVLSADLDGLRREMIEALALDRSALLDRGRRILQGMIDHVLRYEGVYGIGHASSIFALRVVLAEHVEKSMQDILHYRPAVLPEKVSKALTLYSAFLAHGVAGAFDAWLRLPSPRDPERLLAVVEDLYPSWFWDGSLPEQF
ncbi:conserved hypothetical protein [Agrobacterium fabacearum CFBP 5771]|jgi:AcrR family transcriptional regulator|uniref:TetR/AcrR family transcriptional regulator n=2 Tax=Agrobacterium tumefaciens complex TaxID=1183400 RepID=A0A4D7YLV5_AGRTU|nr:TetR/AcrR family transcriptional regulator [Agrobacterium tumefaciens]CVI24773.1 conserved hypothetical protein [Agrobacterium fabacearum CFBP 5771]